MIILHDSIGYELSGRMITNQGWIEYFRTGPNREPFYPFLISLSMKIGNFFSISYQTILIFIQLLLIFLTQILTLKILKLLNINKYITALTILYWGFSPALVNSTFCLFSEIASFPFIPAIVLIIYFSIVNLLNPTPKLKKIYWLAVYFGLIFLFITLTKGIFEIITPILLVLTSLIASTSRPKPNYKIIVAFFIIASSVFYVPLTAYKSLNLKYNGNFTLTERGAWALYGNTERRMVPLTTQRFLAGLSYVGGNGFCRLFFNESACTDWSYIPSDNYGALKRQSLQASGLSTQEVNHQLVILSFKKAISNPPQYLLLWFVEGMKMQVWESLDMAYVLLSDSLLRIYNFLPLKLGIFFTIPILICISFIQTGGFILSKISQKSQIHLKDDTVLILSIILILIIIYISLYSFFFILARYAFPIASLYLILIAFSSDQALKFFTKKKA